MTASRTPAERTSLVSRVVDYEPPPVGVTACRSTALRRRAPRPYRAASCPPVRDGAPPHAAILFADTALRRVLEAIDRRRSVAQLRLMLAPAVIDTVIALTRSSHAKTATLRRVRLRMVEGDCVDTGGAPHVREAAAEVFGTYTRGPRVHAIAARIALAGDRWTVVALQLG